MQARDRGSGADSRRNAVFLEDLCPKVHLRQWRRSLHRLTGHRCIYCGDRSESIDHVHPRSRGGSSVTENCVPACLGCNGRKGDTDAFQWYRHQSFYDPRRAMAIRAWTDGDLRLAVRLLQWSAAATEPVGGEAEPALHRSPPGVHQTRQAASPLWRWQMAA
ncbi:MAG: HNH endonuclease [Synechococcaceae cyanobacterium]|nr:HNH endonuclease [Synechococcaceae cyanobacterium]